MMATNKTAHNDNDEDARTDEEGQSSNKDERPNKKARRATEILSGFPRTFVTWNCNGLTSRCKYNPEALAQLLLETKYPDVLCWQEVRLKAASSTDRGRPLASEYHGAVQNALQEVFGDDYDQYWSLADTKYAGTLTLIRRRKTEPPPTAAFSPQAAINLLLQQHGLTREYCGLKAATSVLSRSKNNDKKQASVKSFFATKPSSLSATSTQHHHPDGRFQFFRFHGMDLIHTYVPNNGNKQESFQYRREWDEEMNDFLVARRRIYETAGIAEECLPRLLWCGDLNVARDYRDGTHWEMTRRQPNSNNGDEDVNGPSGSNRAPSIYEWWTDETKCFASGAARKTTNNSSDPDNIGIAGFTAAERRRFNNLLQEADFSDVWRELHPNGCAHQQLLLLQHQSSPWDQPNWTWRGHLSKNESKRSKYQGKGQRLDYFLLSPSSATGQIVESCEILGYGERRDGLFCGSDHCAVSLTLIDGGA